jgi:hypothetical protein
MFCSLWSISSLKQSKSFPTTNVTLPFVSLLLVLRDTPASEPPSKPLINSLVFGSLLVFTGFLVYIAYNNICCKRTSIQTKSPPSSASGKEVSFSFKGDIKTEATKSNHSTLNFNIRLCTKKDREVASFKPSIHCGSSSYTVTKETEICNE